MSFVLSPGADLDSREPHQEKEGSTERSPAADGETELTGLHAKLFLFENGGEARLFVGSANATRAAFQSNAEVLVELVGPTSDCGIAALLGTEDDARLETLRSLLQEYHPPERLEEEDQRALEKEVERLACTLGAARLTAAVREVEAGQRWDIALSGTLPSLPDGATLKVWPATLPAESALAIESRPAGSREPQRTPDPIATFPKLSFEALTAFFACEVSLQQGKHEACRRFAVTAELLGVPEDRKERLLRSLLADRRRVLRLLFLILMDEGADASTFADAANRDQAAPGASRAAWDSTALLEALLRSLSRDPRRIDDAARLIDDLRKTAEGEELLPIGLTDIWEPVWAARQALKP